MLQLAVDNNDNRNVADERCRLRLRLRLQLQLQLQRLRKLIRVQV